ncbi:hypothetical protein QTH87_09660 [Variovorax sp. J22P168]|uniref:DUF6587 family protein n=1 Tax=Variovorax jilinensis TaxID=3053513 RepID=UPI0025768B28|nr:DUF6587 family protein [Variovorax sp. J22P168]MDM0012695.1 hypothetical protein [Variovorax sp. J22P168]
MTQQIVVALIVGLAAIYAVWRWMPARWRRGAAGRLAAGSQRAGLVDAERAERLAATLGKASGCGSCDSCGSCAPSARPGQQDATDTSRTVHPH